ncbi:MAG: hypothetical protein OQK82_08485 [Candidatus Pacearchaeota archaeon]|nr:hypothetical protein [Candidatus Pacearchaeota archaeon]
MKQPEPLDQHQLAALMGITTRRLRQIAEESPPPREEGRGALYPCKDAGKWLRAYWSPDGALDPQHEKAALDKVRREIAELERDKRKGTLLDAKEVETVWMRSVGEVRAGMLAVPSRVAPELIALTDEREMEDAVRDAIHEAMEAIADDAQSAD